MPASANALWRSPHLLHRPQCSSPVGAMQEKVCSSASPWPRDRTSDLVSAENGDYRELLAEGGAGQGGNPAKTGHWHPRTVAP